MFVQLLSSPHMNVVDQAVWALGNIAGDGSNLREMAIKSGIIPPLVTLIRPNMQVSIVVIRNNPLGYGVVGTVLVSLLLTLLSDKCDAKLCT